MSYQNTIEEYPGNFVPSETRLRKLLLRSTENFAQKSSPLPADQWLVPSDLVILFQTLYLPTGFFIGRRFTSFSVSAS